MTDNTHELLRDAVDTFGEAMQMIVCMEEMSELTKELSKNLRGFENTAQIAEEIADVEITLDQMKIIFNCDYDVETQKASKLLRLAARIDDEKVRRTLNER